MLDEVKTTDTKTVTLNKTTFIIKRQFGMRPINDLRLEHMMNMKNMGFDGRPAL